MFNLVLQLLNAKTMAQQTGPLLLEATIGGLTFYKKNGKHYVKRKTAVSCTNIRTDSRYSNTFRNATCFGQAVKLAQQVYYQLPRDQRGQFKTWYPMLNRAQELIRKQIPYDEIIQLLQE